MPDFNELVTELTSREADGVPGVVALALRNGKGWCLPCHGKGGVSQPIELVKVASGYTSIPSSATPIDFDSIFQWSSSTKIITAIAALQCVERGLIGLDDPVYEHLPELKGLTVISIVPTGEGIEPELKFTPTDRQITLRQLLTHTSGIGMDNLDPRLQAWRKSRGEEPKAFSGNAIKAFNMPLIFEPGQSWMYGSG